MQVHLLGGFTVRVAGRDVDEPAWRLRRARTLIKVLALAPERRLHRELLVELMWPDEPPTGNSFHQVVYTARRALGEAGSCVEMHDGVVTLAGDVWVDVDAFEAKATEARALRTVDAYRAALELYTGELLPEDRYEQWAHNRRAALHETQLALRVELAALQAEADDRAGAVETLQRAIVEDPLHEAAHRELMRLFARDGRGQQALAQYQQLRDALRTELGADPDPLTRELYRELLAGQHEPASESRLPRQLTTFVGRDRELTELERLLGGRARLVTLTGPGGCGKTRLALELAARREADFALGARLVELAPIRDPALVIGETVRALGVQLRSGEDPVAAIASQIGEAGVLLVLDNCEHLVDAAAALADTLLRACANARIVATSRERLRIGGETAWRVPSLSLPAAGAADSEAGRLFCERAAEASRTFALTTENAAAVAEICRRLDGMPLALELAAARSDVLSPAQIADRLGDALALLRAESRTTLTRQQSLRATLAWSHDLLSDHERLLYRRLGVFAGSFTVEAVEGICSGELDALARLADKSLVHVDAAPSGHRYRMLDTISQHAREQLDASGEHERLEAAHRIWYLGIAEAADRDRDPAVAAAWPADRLEAEHDDLRAALASAIWTDPPTALRLAAALWWFWMARGYFAEASRRLDDVLAAAPEPTPERMRALFAAAGIAVRLRSGSVERVVALGSEALDIARACGDRRTVARALERHGVLAMGAFAFSVADRAFSEALAIGDESLEPAIKQAQGVLAASRGDNAAARALFEDCLARLEDERTAQFWALHISPVVIPTGAGGAPRAFFEDTFVLLRTVGRTAGTGYVLCNIGEAWRADGEFAAAREPLEQALELFRDIGDHQGAGVALNVLGNLARSTGDYDAGRRYFAEALVLRRASGDRREIATTLLGMGTLALYAGDESGRRLIEQAVQIFDRTEDGPGQQLTPLNLAAYELDRGDPRRACELLERVAIADDDVLMGGRGWAAAALAEAAIAIDDSGRAQSALALALTRFEALGEARGVRYVGELQSRLARMMSGC